ncbi:Cu(I)-responsive transcriptional regulator [Acinetobacter qingfengensis]|uniref:Cu(I)-responsive transcriptional regulator n=1 Tax=Acinetobacter qingfengensis TaxID=1262585 RepID=A0A1E7RCU3_9GAMM|nr:Cu(I)-responsive transcriptional regulator [Acinetobacter qingfengensis]KAA8734985.1 Cu(I)-responsive transcriptional regulator [Acinetobacter qingfengensis]OEY97072.1 Cu(I)-responsive transcriptional regulator [Acinetobacter qingfengensis]
MNISQAAHLSRISAKMIRYYENIGLLPKVARSHTGYREYFPVDIERLKFIYQARQLGFSLDTIKTLLQLQQDQHRRSADVKYIAQQHVDELENKIQKMQAMVKHLKLLIQDCAGDQTPDCVILNKIQQEDI